MSDNPGSNPQPVYIVLGATGGIGGDLCRRLAARNARIIAAGRSAEKIAAIGDVPGLIPFVMEGGLLDGIERAVNFAVENCGKVDGIANCIGSLLLKPAHLTTDADWAATIETNLTSAFGCVRAASRVMTKTGGSIVLVSSAAGRVGLANHEAIAAAKAGIIGLAQSAAASYAPRGIRVNCVAPGLVQTPMTTRITQNETARKASESMHALGRIGQAREVASAIDWLLDPAQGWVTGQVIGVDGGLSTVRAK